MRALVLLLAFASFACGSSKNSSEITLVPTPWELMGKRIGETEAAALVTLRFGCSGCTRFVANELLVLPDGEFVVFDLNERRERNRGKASKAVMQQLEALLVSDEWRRLEEGQTAITSARPWLEIRAHGKPVRRHSPIEEGHEPVLDQLMELFDHLDTAQGG